LRRAAVELPPWKISGLGRSGVLSGLGFKREVVDAVEVAAEIDVVLGPDLAQDLQELRAATVPLVVLEPRLAEMGELVLEPARDDVDGEPPVAQLVGGGAQLGQHGGLPEAWMNGGDHLEPLSCQQKRQAEARRLVLVLGAVAGLVAHLGQRVVEAVILRGLGELDVVVVAPVGALLDVAGDQSPADVGHPICELDVICDAFSRHGLP
jgi:hypothetical protein